MDTGRSHETMGVPSPIRPSAATSSETGLFTPAADDEDTSVTIGKIAAYLHEVETKQARLSAAAAAAVTTTTTAVPPFADARTSPAPAAQAVSTTTVVTSTGAGVEAELRRQLAECRQTARTRELEAGEIRAMLDNERDGWRRQERDLRAECERLRSANSSNGGGGGGCSKAEYARLHAEHADVLHVSLAMQREAAQLRTQLLEAQTKAAAQVREARWELVQEHQAETAALRARADAMREEHAAQLAQLHRAEEADRAELLRRLAATVGADEHAALAAALAERDDEVRALRAAASAAHEAAARASDGAAERAARAEEEARRLQAEAAEARAAADRWGAEAAARAAAAERLEQQVADAREAAAREEAERAQAVQAAHAAGQELRALTDKHELLKQFHEDKEQGMFCRRKRSSYTHTHTHSLSLSPTSPPHTTVVEKLQRDYESTIRREAETASALDSSHRERARLDDREAALSAELSDAQARLDAARRDAGGLRARVSALESDFAAAAARAAAAQREHAADCDAQAARAAAAEDSSRAAQAGAARDAAALAAALADVRGARTEAEAARAAAAEAREDASAVRVELAVAEKGAARAVALAAKLAKREEVLARANARVLKYEVCACVWVWRVGLLFLPFFFVSRRMRAGKDRPNTHRGILRSFCVLPAKMRKSWGFCSSTQPVTHPSPELASHPPVVDHAPHSSGSAPAAPQTESPSAVLPRTAQSAEAGWGAARSGPSQRCLPNTTVLPNSLSRERAVQPLLPTFLRPPHTPERPASTPPAGSLVVERCSSLPTRAEVPRPPPPPTSFHPPSLVACVSAATCPFSFSASV